MPKTVTHEAKSDIKRLTYRRFEVVRLFGGCNRLVEAERMAWRYVSDRSPESGSSFDWTSMAKAELTAENRPA